MDYFKYFSRINFEHEKETITSPDFISVPVAAIDFLKTKKSNFVEYLIRDKESPEFISEKMYETPKYAWIILLANNIVDWNSEFPLSNHSLMTFLMNKYYTKIYDKVGDSLVFNKLRSEYVTRQKIFFEGTMDAQYTAYEYYDANGGAVILEPHHFELNDQIVPWFYYNTRGDFARPVSIYEHENNENDKKRKIFIPHPSMIFQLENDLKQIMGKG